MVADEGPWLLRREATGTPSAGEPAAALDRLRPGRAAGFTLLEILLAIALIGMLAMSLITISWHLIGDRPLTADEVFWQATREARKAALKSEHDQRLSFDEKAVGFVVTDGVATKNFPVPPVRDLEINFLPGSQGKSSVLIGGELVDTRNVPSVTFYADGTCMPFRVQFRAGGPARVLTIDPWTCAAVITGAETNP